MRMTNLLAPAILSVFAVAAQAQEQVSSDVPSYDEYDAELHACETVSYSTDFANAFWQAMCSDAASDDQKAQTILELAQKLDPNTQLPVLGNPIRACIDGSLPKMAEGHTIEAVLNRKPDIVTVGQWWIDFENFKHIVGAAQYACTPTS